MSASSPRPPLFIIVFNNLPERIPNSNLISLYCRLGLPVENSANWECNPDNFSTMALLNQNKKSQREDNPFIYKPFKPMGFYKISP